MSKVLGSKRGRLTGMAKPKRDNKQPEKGRLRRIMEERGYADREKRDKVGKTAITIRTPR